MQQYEDYLLRTSCGRAVYREWRKKTGDKMPAGGGEYHPEKVS